MVNSGGPGGGPGGSASSAPPTPSAFPVAGSGVLPNVNVSSESFVKQLQLRQATAAAASAAAAGVGDGSGGLAHGSGAGGWSTSRFSTLEANYFLGLPHFNGGKIFHFIAKHFKVPPNHPDPESVKYGIRKIMAAIAKLVKAHAPAPPSEDEPVASAGVGAGGAAGAAASDVKGGGGVGAGASGAVVGGGVAGASVSTAEDEAARARAARRRGSEKLRAEYIEKRDNDNLTPAFLAAIENNLTVFMELVTKYHADTDVIDKSGNTLLHAALRWTKSDLKRLVDYVATKTRVLPFNSPNNVRSCPRACSSASPLIRVSSFPPHLLRLWRR
jgi:hypothetical protein